MCRPSDFPPFEPPERPRCSFPGCRPRYATTVYVGATREPRCNAHDGLAARTEAERLGYHRFPVPGRHV